MTETHTKLRTAKLHHEEQQNFAVRGLNREMVERLEDAIKAYGTKKRFAEIAGIPLSTLNEALKSGRSPRFDTMAAIADTLGKSLEWVRTGHDGSSPLPDPEFIAVPVLPEAISAGSGSHADVNDQKADKHVMMGREFLRSLSINPHKAALLTVRGESMEPTLSGGDTILIDTGNTDISTDGIFVIANNGGAMVKRLTRRSDGSIMVISDNQALYPPEIITAAEADSFRVIGRVRWHARTLR